MFEAQTDDFTLIEVVFKLPPMRATKHDRNLPSLSRTRQCADQNAAAGGSFVQQPRLLRSREAEIDPTRTLTRRPVGIRFVR
jgi:hypothetical protein